MSGKHTWPKAPTFFWQSNHLNLLQSLCGPGRSGGGRRTPNGNWRRRGRFHQESNGNDSQPPRQSTTVVRRGRWWERSGPKCLPGLGEILVPRRINPPRNSMAIVDTFISRFYGKYSKDDGTEDQAGEEVECREGKGIKFPKRNRREESQKGKLQTFQADPVVFAIKKSIEKQLSKSKVKDPSGPTECVSSEVDKSLTKKPSDSEVEDPSRPRNELLSDLSNLEPPRMLDMYAEVFKSKIDDPYGSSDYTFGEKEVSGENHPGTLKRPRTKKPILIDATPISITLLDDSQGEVRKEPGLAILMSKNPEDRTTLESPENEELAEDPTEMNSLESLDSSDIIPEKLRTPDAKADETNSNKDAEKPKASDGDPIKSFSEEHRKDAEHLLQRMNDKTLDIRGIMGLTISDHSISVMGGAPSQAPFSGKNEQVPAQRRIPPKALAEQGSNLVSGSRKAPTGPKDLQSRHAAGKAAGPGGKKPLAGGAGAGKGPAKGPAGAGGKPPGGAGGNPPGGAGGKPPAAGGKKPPVAGGKPPAGKGGKGSGTRVITLMPGDGIGPEISMAVLQVLEAAKVPLIFEPVDVTPVMDKFGRTTVPEAVVESMNRTKVGLKGPLMTPVGTGFRSLNLTLRQLFNLYANIRPCRSLPGVETVYGDVDIITIRENTEGEYSGIEHTLVNGVVQSIKLITRNASLRVAEYAFQYALDMKRKKVTAVGEENAMRMSDGLFLRCVKEMSEKYKSKLESAGIEFEFSTMTTVCLNIVQNPKRYDVLVLPNLYGDIISDTCAGLIGGLGLTPSGNIGTEGAIFESVHGTAPDIAGKDLANPTALLLSTCMLLHYVGMPDQAEKIKKSILKTLTEGNIRTKDLGGNSKCSEYTKELIKNLK
ncbi:uncharacterized protein [Drosophila bipectinata]|uniref:uncharacterized protein n=1 Tax=Drosophila bipectinata TaxID=42026 RepID=UPI001C88E449|nr:uncharacterized protein LOC108134197 [Drosophila bipectinata]